MPVMQSGKFCANCVYWTGEREMNAFFGRMEVDTSAKGKCINMKSFYNCPMSWQAGCSKFEKHPIVK